MDAGNGQRSNLPLGGISQVEIASSLRSSQWRINQRFLGREKVRTNKKRGVTSMQTKNIAKRRIEQLRFPCRTTSRWHHHLRKMPGSNAFSYLDSGLLRNGKHTGSARTQPVSGI